jgi:solute carrier family 25, member 39/40
MSQTVVVAAGVGSVASVLICTPFDVVKNYWQGSPSLNHQRSSTSSLAIYSKITREFGLRGLWRGTGVALVYSLPNNLTYFNLYEHYKTKYGNATLAAAHARVVAVLCFSPLEFLRTNVQARIGQPGSNTAGDVLRRVLRDEGVVSMWRGATATLMRDVPFSMTYFSIYEMNKSWLLPDGEVSSGFKTFGVSFINGAACGAIATCLTHPFDIVKTQLQSYERIRSVDSVNVAKVYTTLRAARAIGTEYGMRGLFTIGLAPRLAKVIPGSAIMLGTYELVSLWLTEGH